MNSSTLFIQSQQQDNHSMGTGFVIHQDSFGSYILTCAHVIEEVVEPKIDELDVEVRSMGSSETLDLALLYVKGLFRTPFKLQTRRCSSDDVQLIGFSFFSKGKYQGKVRDATILGDKVSLKGISQGTEYTAWQIVTKNKYEVEHGNSGGPLLCQESGKVIGVMSNNKDGKYGGYAIAIEHLRDIWDDMPPFLFESDDENESPFVGLSAFGIEQSHLFFGRDKEIAELIEKLKKEDLIAVVGDSGSGKSSLIKAGVIPKYLNGALAEEENANFYLLDTRPAKNPFNELSYSISKIAEEFQLEFNDINQIKIAIRSKNKESVLNGLEQIFKKENATLLIYIDQFEELFTLCEEELQKEFIEVLLYLLNNQSFHLKIKIIFTMRRDYYNLISEYEAFFKLTQASKYTLRRMQNEQIKACIEKPLERTYIDPEQISAFSKAVLQDMGDEASELTLLQIALTQTWEHKDEYDNDLLRTYHEIGEVSGALAKLADNTWQVLSSAEKKILQHIFIRIIKPSDTGGVTRRLADRDEFSVDAWNLAQKLSSALDREGSMASEKNAQLGRLLKIKGDEGKVLELTHEALIHQWPKYQVWLRQVTKDNLKRTHDYVIEQNKIYQAHGKAFKFRLRGYELEQSEKLLDKKYKEYLSQEEIAFIEKSVFYRRVIKGLVGFTALLIIGLAGALYLFNQKIERVSNSLVSFLNPSVDRVIELLIDNPDDIKNIKYGAKIFPFIVSNFKNNKEQEVIVAKSWYGMGLILYDLNRTKDAMAVNREFIETFKDSSNPKVFDYVARAWLNRGAILEESNEEKAFEIYLNLLKYLEEKKEMKPNFFIARVYSDLGWLALLRGEYGRAKVYLEKGMLLNSEDENLTLNLAHLYLLSNRVEEAKEIYLNKGGKMAIKEWKDMIKQDFEDLENHEVSSSHFDEIRKMLNL